MTASNNAKPTLRQRINLIQAEVKQPQVTGTNQYHAASLSIDDVEEALQPLLAKFGVVIRHTHAEAPIWMPDANPPAWLVCLAITVENSDDAADHFIDTSYDTGSNLSAAVSYALKRYEKGLFKIGGEEAGSTTAAGGGSRQTRAANTPTSPHPVAASAPPAQPTRGYRRPEAPVAGPGNAPGAKAAPAASPEQDEFDREWAESLAR